MIITVLLVIETVADSSNFQSVYSFHARRVNLETRDPIRELALLKS